MSICVRVRVRFYAFVILIVEIRYGLCICYLCQVLALLLFFAIFFHPCHISPLNVDYFKRALLYVMLFVLCYRISWAVNLNNVFS